MRLKQGENEARKAFVQTMLLANPRASYAALQKGLKDQFGHAMQQQLLKSYVEEFTATLVPAVVGRILNGDGQEITESTDRVVIEEVP